MSGNRTPARTAAAWLSRDREDRGLPGRAGPTGTAVCRSRRGRAAVVVAGALLMVGSSVYAAPSASAATTCDGVSATIRGTAKRDFLEGTAGRDVIGGRGGGGWIDGNVGD